MKCLTILQSYAHLICCLAADDPRRKRVENRTHDHFKSHRGLLLIHAGKSKQMVWPYRSDAVKRRDHYTNNFGIPHEDLMFGAILGAVDVASHFELGHMSAFIGSFEVEVNGAVAKSESTSVSKKIIPAAELKVRPWLETHQHVEGRFCLVFENIRRFKQPIPCKGLQGIWNLPKSLESEVKAAIKSAEVLP